MHNIFIPYTIYHVKNIIKIFKNVYKEKNMSINTHHCVNNFIYSDFFLTLTFVFQKTSSKAP